MAPAAQESAEETARHPEARLAIGLFLAVFSLFLLMSAASYDPADPPLSNYPPNRTIENLGGSVGAYLGGGLHFIFGSASYVLLLLVGGAGYLLITDRSIRAPKTKLASALFLLLSSACLLDLVFQGERSSASGPGGIFGRLLNTHLFLKCGWGAWLALIALFFGSLIFLTEFAPVRLAGRTIAWWRRKRFERGRLRGIVDVGPETQSSIRRETPKLPAEADFSASAFVETHPAQPAKRPSPEAPPIESFGPAEAPEQRPPEYSEPTAGQGAETVAEEQTDAASHEGAVADPPPPPEPRPQAVEEAGPEPLPEPDEEPEPKTEADSTSDGSAADESEAVEAEEAPDSRRQEAERPPLVGEDFDIPSPSLLDAEEERDYSFDDNRLQQVARMLENTLEEFNVDAQVVEVDRGPVITMYEIELAPGIKIGKIVGLADDIARALSASSVRIVAPIPGKSTVGIEVPNPERETVRLRDIFESGVLERKQLAIPMLLGKDASGQPLVSDLAQMPHCMIAGATGTGKSVCINSLIVSLLLTQHPDKLKLLLIDPKMVEFAQFKEVPHLLAPVVTDMKKATSVLEWATVKMDERYEFLAAAGARNIVSFNALGEDGIRERLGADEETFLDDFPTFLPYIVIIIDELADLMMVANKEVENSIIRLAQKSRAVGIHLIIATQRPSVDVITGLIKSNLPSRIALQVASKVDSRTILDRNGAEKLLGQGDMLFLPPGSSKLIRAQGAFVSDAEIRRIVQTMKKQEAKPVFDEELVRQRSMGDKMPWERDELFCEAVKIVAESQRGSVSLLQRRLTVGYSRAARLIDMMAEMGLVGEYKGSQAREVTVTPEEWEEMLKEYEQS